MGTDPKAEFLDQIARLDELIDKSTELIEKTDALLNRAVDSFVRQSLAMLMEAETTA